MIFVGILRFNYTVMMIFKVLGRDYFWEQISENITL